jgi:L-alanine-DL-glutamate epimerase-like enolase superfamily enzyme
MPTIERIETIPYRLPLQGALAWGRHSRLEAAEHVLVRVHLGNGVVGTAEAPPRPTIYGETVVSIQGILAYLSPALVGLEIDDADAIRKIIQSVPNNNVARGALDMAIWDARVQADAHSGSPSSLIDALAGPNRLIRVSYILGISDPDTMLDEAKRVFEAGVRVLKVKVGRDSARDLEVIGLLRQSLPEVDLYADSNETLEPERAAHALEAMRQAGLVYVEEPLPVRQIRARASLKREAILPIIADDSCFNRLDLERELDFDTFDILNIKTARNGFTESLEMINLARAAGKGVMIGSQASTTLGTVHAAIISSLDGVTHPCELSFFLKLQTEIVNRVPKLEAGYLDLDGLRDIQVDSEQLKRHRI